MMDDSIPSQFAFLSALNNVRFPPLPVQVVSVNLLPVYACSISILYKVSAYFVIFVTHLSFHRQLHLILIVYLYESRRDIIVY